MGTETSSQRRVPPKERDENGILKYFESERIHTQAIVVGEYSEAYSHWNAEKSLQQWLREEKVPAICGVDTRALIKELRSHGVMLGKLLIGEDVNHGEKVPLYNPNAINLATLVSIKEPKTFGSGSKNIVLVDLGVKLNQIRCFLRRGVSVTVVPWDFDFNTLIEKGKMDGLFLSNGPGDPAQLVATIQNLEKFFAENGKRAKPIPLFGICMGNLVIGRAIGGESYKLRFGNRGHNQPCIDQSTKRCFLTSQNHGFAINPETLPKGWIQAFINANDSSNEGLAHTSLPYYSVQFHPEASAGPEETEYLFDDFLSVVNGTMPSMIRPPVERPPRLPVRKVLILGSGGLSIGQAGEFDYSGSQAIKAFKEEGVETILLNPNIATVQTDLADKVYFLPVNVESIEKIFVQDRPDAIAVTFGGQTALNTAVKLYEQKLLEKYDVRVLGTPIQSIIDSEDRELFSVLLQGIGEKLAPSASASTVEEAVNAARSIGYPVMIRAAFALGGLGSGVVANEEALVEKVQIALATSPQVLVEKSLQGWKEIEYEVVRDQYDNCVTVCNMENFDPMGVHTGESIVVAPSQTLSNREYQLLRNTALKVVRRLGIIGECNIQYALDPNSEDYCIIEVNARLSRSSALASKATGYPLAHIAAKLGLGHDLSLLKNDVTKVTSACFEPSLDYLVVKMPLWDLKKFDRVSRKIATQMKSVGEVMAIGRSFQEAIQKAIRSIGSAVGFTQRPELSEEEIEESLASPDDTRIFSVATALQRQWTVDRIHSLSRIDRWFLSKLKTIIDLSKQLSEWSGALTEELLRNAKGLGFSDKQIAIATKSTELIVRKKRKDFNITPFVKQIDTLAAEFPAQNNYLYTTYLGDIIVLGSGPYRIGSSVEFDWCCVNLVKQLQRTGHASIMINCNPETVSTDYDTCARLYFDELSFERVLDIYELESAHGVVISVGGQIPNNLAMPLFHQNVRILGTEAEMIDMAENRYKFSRLCDSHDILQPRWRQLTGIEEAAAFCDSVGYPTLVRPSYILSGSTMKVIHSEGDLKAFLSRTDVSHDHPVVVSKEIEIDAVALRGQIMCYAISEHVENAGVHSGDATLVLPPVDLHPATVQRIREIAAQIAHALAVTGPFNMQFMAKDNQVQVIECNLRASRSFPFVSKTLKTNFIKLVADFIVNPNIQAKPIEPPTVSYVGVKVAQFRKSFNRLPGADPVLGVDMASTGEVACFGATREEAFFKALTASGFNIRTSGEVLLSIGPFSLKQEFIPAAKKLVALGYGLWGTTATADFFAESDVPIKVLDWAGEGLVNMFKSRAFALFINLPSYNKWRRPQDYTSKGYTARRLAVDYGVPIITDIKKAKLLVESLHCSQFELAHHDSASLANVVRLPGLIDLHVHLREPGGEHKETWASGTQAAVAGGFTVVCAMPNTNPSVTDHKVLTRVEQIARSSAYCDYMIYAGASQQNADAIHEVAPRVAGLKMYLNHTYSTLQLDLRHWLDHVKNWPKDSPLAVHAEHIHLPAITLFAKMFERPIHILHVSLRDEIDVIRACKAAGVAITCEVCPHHLFFSREADAERLGSRIAVCPRIATQADVDYLWANLDVVDTFGTDHAPHLPHEKEGESPSPGYPGLETIVPLLLTAVHQKRLTMEDLINKLYHNPKDTYIEVDLDKEWTIPQATKFTKAGWTPFAGFKVTGQVKRTVIRGRTVYLDGEIVSEPGVGLNLRLVEAKERRAGTVEEIRPSDILRPIPLKVEDRLDDWAHNPRFLGKSILSVNQFSAEDLRLLFRLATQFKLFPTKPQYKTLLKGKILCTMFYEPSTRTQNSFVAAMQRLGGETIAINEGTSSTKKGETLQDTVRTIELYSDAVVLRHPEAGSAQAAASYMKKPLFNGGDGVGEHPTQALLDVFTIREEMGTINGMELTIVGDLKHGRTTHSLVRLLARIYNVTFHYVSPPELKMPQDIQAEVASYGRTQTEHTDLSDVLPHTDVLYVTRMQKERFASEEDYLKIKDSYLITPEVMTAAKDRMCLLHPLPRTGEIDERVDADERAAYFRQMENGVYVRMALLYLVLGRSE